jgi:nicotinate phosphoribosyltransferase
MILKSILDNDLYKFSMMNAVMRKFPNAKVKYEFINRGQTKFPENFGNLLRKEVKEMEKLFLTKEEKIWLKNNCPYLDHAYITQLGGYKYDSSQVTIIQKEGDLKIHIEGYWVDTILWEVPLMALISEMYFELYNEQVPISIEDRTANNLAKKSLFIHNGVHFADFGTRRRFSYDNQDKFISDMVEGHKFPNFVGTSNVFLAYKYDVTPIGTHAHEWFMFHAAKYGYKMANHLAMENWTDVFRGDLGIALSDTFTTEVFFKAFDKKFAKLYDGVRHDSGDAYEFTDKVVKHYNSLGIDPKSKVIVFSDGLNPEKAVEIKNYCRGKIKCSFGIGTNFSNDVGVTPLNMVIKMVSAKPEDEEWMDCIKLSDSKGKHIGNKKEIEIAKYVLGIK